MIRVNGGTAKLEGSGLEFFVELSTAIAAVHDAYEKRYDNIAADEIIALAGRAAALVWSEHSEDENGQMAEEHAKELSEILDRYGIRKVMSSVDDMR